MDLSRIETPSQLVQMNDVSEDNQDSINTLVRATTHHDPEVSLGVIRELLLNLISWHNICIEDFVKEGDVQNVANWTADNERMCLAIAALRDVRC